MTNQHIATMGALMLCAASLATPALGQTLTFSGTRENVTPLSPPGGRCVPPYFNTVNIVPGNISSTGTSNISTFTSTQSHCIVTAPPTPFVDGTFTYTFEGGDTIFGTYTGIVATGATPGAFTATENLIITGGTGRFIGASGTIDSNGSLVFGNGVSNFQGTLSGGITATAATASGAFATAFGSPSAATGDYSSAFGSFALASGSRSTALGTFAEATGPGTIAIGDNSFASGDRSIAVGVNARSTNAFTVAMGNSSLATGLNATAVGPFAQATGMGASAFGNGALANSAGSVALGVRSTASGANSSAVGALSVASGVGATALGRASTASADNSTAVGTGSVAAFAGSTAIGANAATTAANQVTLGAAATSVRVGDITASTAAQQASSVGVATVDANGTLGRNTTLLGTVSTLQSAQATLQSDVTSLFDLADRNRGDIREANEGVAMALAMDTPSIPAGARVAVSGGIGYFKNRTALASAVAIAVGEMSQVSAGLGYGFNSKEVGARAGFQFAW